jgi:hypothetical protein
MIEWKKIEEVDGKYEISNTGIIRNRLTKNIISQFKNNAGYYRVNIGLPSKKYFVHRLVAKYFINGYFEGAVVNHKDCNKTNNFYSNLEWVTRSYNSKHAYINGLQHGSFNKKPYIYKNVLYKTSRDLAKFLKISKSTFYDKIKSGKILIESNDYPYGSSGKCYETVSTVKAVMI